MNLPFLRRPHGHPNNSVPRLEVLEDRCLPSGPGGGSGIPSGIFRTSGAAFQTGSLLTVVVLNKVGEPGTESATITDDGKGDIQVSWDGGAVHSFTGVKDVVLISQPTKTEQVSVNLTGPLTAPLDVQLFLGGKDNTVTEHVGNSGVSPNGLDVTVVNERHHANTTVTVEK